MEAHHAASQQRDLLALVPVSLATLVYLPILNAWFFADDFPTLAILRDGNLPYFLLRPWGGHNFVVRNAVFALSYWNFGPHPALFFATVLAAHALNVWLLFRVLRNLGVSRALACLAATLWGTLPMHAGTLDWYNVYGRVLATSALLLVLDGLTRLTASRTPLHPRTAALWWVLLVLGSMCCGFGIGVACAFPAALFLLLPAAWDHRGTRHAFLALPVVVLATYFACRRLASLLAPLPFDEALLMAVLLTDLRPVAEMLGHLFGFSMASSLLGTYGPAVYPSIAAVAAAGLFALAVGVAFWRAAPAARRHMAAFAALGGGIYAVVAIGRANAAVGFLLMSPARIATAPRYHYVGTVAMVALLCLALREIGHIGWLGRLPRGGLVLVAGGLLAAGFLRHGVRIEDHRACAEYVANTLASITRDTTGHPPGSTVYLENGSTPVFVLGGALQQAVFPGRAAVYLAFGPSDRLRDPRIRFIERDPAIVEMHRALPWSRLGRLLVTPEETPGG
jgi:hypothetical protein